MSRAGKSGLDTDWAVAGWVYVKVHQRVQDISELGWKIDVMWLVLIASITDSRITWEMGLWACLWEVDFDCIN